jgi:predicted nucleic acid-binding protein
VVLADTSVWVEHLRRGEPRLAALLRGGEVLCHPFVAGELACGNLAQREQILALLAALPSLDKVEDDELLHFIALHRLHGRGLGLVDVHLLAACALAGRPLWTLDTRLARAAAGLKLGLD